MGVHGDKKMDGVKNLQLVGIITKQDAQMLLELLKNADGEIQDGVIQNQEDFQQGQWLEVEELSSVECDQV